MIELHSKLFFYNWGSCGATLNEVNVRYRAAFRFPTPEFLPLPLPYSLVTHVHVIVTPRVLISWEVSSFHGVQIRGIPAVLYIEVSSFHGVLIRGVPAVLFIEVSSVSFFHIMHMIYMSQREEGVTSTNSGCEHAKSVTTT